ncbi:MAG: hypothetical protein ACRERD_00370, partial [Candidatus Binatia bacterium]
MRVLNKIEGEIAEAAKQVIQQANVDVRRQDENAARRQFKLAVEAAQQANDLESLRAFLAYQARERDKVWGRSVGGQLLVQVAWTALRRKIQAFETQAGSEVPHVWNEITNNGPRRNEVHLAMASRFFAHIERAFEIWKDQQARIFYFGPPPQQEQSTP